MKLLHLIFEAAFYLQLVSVIAGNDVTTFNLEDVDEDSVDTVLETEQFIQVVDRHSNVPPRNTALKTATYQNSSPVAYSQSVFQVSIPNRSPPSYSDVSARRTWENKTQFEGGGNNISNTKSTTVIEGWTPMPKWEDLEKEYANEEDSFVNEDISFPLGSDISDIRLSRRKRSLPVESGYDVVKSQFDMTGTGSYTKNEVNSALQEYLKGQPDGNLVESEVTEVQPYMQSVSTKTISVDLKIPENAIQRKGIAQILQDLSTKYQLKIRNNLYKVRLPKLQEEFGSLLSAAICFLCRGYQKCEEQQPSIPLSDWFCSIRDSRLYPYGQGAGDNPFPYNDEHAVVTLKTPYTIPFGTEMVDTFWVSANGMLSVKDRFTSFSPQPCSIFNSRRRGKVMAIYWTDFDIKNNDIGQVYSKVVVSRPGSSARDRELIQRANSDVNKYTQERNFQTRVMITATWSDVAPFPVEQNDNERVTVQMVIVSNLRVTYVMYIYAQGALNFNPTYKRDVQVCVNDITLDITRRNFYKFDMFLGNTGSLGLWIFPIGRMKDSRTKCLEWFEDNLYMLSYIQWWNQIVEPCPCSEIEARWSFRWIPSYLEPGCYDIFPMYGQIGRRCCYRRDNIFWNGWFFGSFAIENRRPLSGNLQMSTPYFGNPTAHEENDAAPKRWCCFESNLCDLYYTVRPDHFCVSRFSFRSFFFGDPHIVTLDSQSFTFNGLGEFTLVEVNGTTPNNVTVDFKLQARTCRIKTKNGTLSGGTVFCGLALMNTNKTIITVDIHESGNYMIIYANKQDYTARFRDTESFKKNEGGIYMQKVNDSLMVSTPDDIGFTVSLQQKYNMLDFTVEISATYKNMTRGLLGNYNGISSDDYIFPNGTTLPNTTSERLLFAYGNTWRVTQSILSNHTSKNSSADFDLNFEPLFLDEVNATDLAYAKTICGGEENMACVYDYLATKNEGLARSTTDSLEDFKREEDLLTNRAPIINGTMLLKVTVNESTTIVMTGSDPDNNTFNFVIIDSPGSGFNWSSSNGTFTATYTPRDVNPVSIGVAVNDSKGLQSEIPEVTIRMCSGCSKHGMCNFDDVRAATNYSYFFRASCDCEDPYSGIDCEEDKDGCYDDPCPKSTNCTDIPALEEARTKNAYNCSDCPLGFYLDTNSSKCEDIDECKNNASRPCDPNAYCINTYGSYHCECLPGYRMSPRTGLCVDINECVENQHKCTQICTNIEGSYNCDCYDGYTHIKTNRFECKKMIDPCQNLTNHCSFGCVNSSGVAQCVCEIGKKLSANGTSCEGINECEENLCAQKCNDTDGSYTCSCLPGYSLSDDKLSCDICPPGQFGENCGLACDCRGHADLCDHIKGCICNSNWTGPSCEDDVDECKTLVNPCPAEQLCANAIGFYTCVCPPGYEDTYNNGSCFNIDECKDQAVHKCSYKCVDSPGSFTCLCLNGYIKTSNNTCEDINECKMGIAECNEICINMEGSFNCECSPGYKLDADRKTCIIDLDNPPCQGFNMSCDHICQIVDGAPKCKCHTGYTLRSDNKSCDDVNECTNGESTCTNTCVNTNGSFNCTCNEGSLLMNDRRTCKVCDGYHWGQNCSNICDCNPKGSSGCDPVQGCTCKPGWGGTRCNIDKDECNENQKVCPDFSTCLNTIGSFLCQCHKGFQEDINSTTCSDIDECKLGTCEQMCNNTVGSYVCSCDKGFGVNGDKCKDINECEKPELSGCDQDCRNTIGGFACECYKGYTLNTTTRNTCYRDPKLPPCNCSDICTFNNGTDVCSCRPGYQLAANNISCENINECQVSSRCVNGTCRDVSGSFYCDCAVGFKLDADQVTCKECDQGFYGSNCTQSCNCNITTTNKCSATNGSCDCIDGWNGSTCSYDIDECRPPNAVICGDEAKCVNLPGSYKCVCEIGFFPTDNGNCAPCDANSYGQDCLSKCSCVMANTADCDDRNGTCSCRPGWNGTLCDMDIDECKATTDFCPNANDTCHNLNGSAECRCDIGFYPTLPSGVCTACDANSYGQDCLSKCSCVMANTADCDDRNGTCSCRPGWNGTLCDMDFDECKATTDYCPKANDTCHNLNGSAECRCDIGFHQTLPSGVCTACDANSYGQDCLSKCSCVMANTADCDDRNGTCSCRPGWNGTLCEMDFDECKATTDFCPKANDTCHNLNGSAECRCDIGFYQTLPSSVCTACDDTHYGQDCLATCKCVQTNTQDCDNINGSCSCKAGWGGTICDVQGPQPSGAAYSVEITLRYSDNQIAQFGDIFTRNSDAFRGLAVFIEVALYSYGIQILPYILVRVKISHFIKGSIIANTTVYIDEKNSTNPPADASKLIYNLMSEKNLTVNGTDVPMAVTAVADTRINDSLPQSSSMCSILNYIAKCKAGEECVEKDGSVSCQPTQTPSGSNTDLIIGLAVGIPLFILLVIIVALLAVFYVRRKRRSQQQSSSQSVDHGAPFRSQFPTRVSTKGSWGAPQQLYAPDAYSEVSANESGNGALNRARDPGRSGFQDSPWYDNTKGAAAASAAPGSNDTSAEPTGPTSNFSWEYMFRLLEPHRDFEIQRPYFESQPNPAFVTKDPDSAA